MRDEERGEFMELVIAVNSYYRQEVSDFLMDVWWEGCKPFSLQSVSRACSAHVRDPDRGSFPVKVADIVRQLGGTSGQRAQLAWGKVHDAMKRVGAYSDVVFDDAVVHAVIADLGDWPTLCRTEVAELSYLQHRFGESYKAVSERGVAGYPRVLQGDRSSDEDFKRRGLPVPMPVLIGDREACLDTWHGGGSARSLITHLKSGTDIAALVVDAVPRLPGKKDDEDGGEK